MAKNNPNDAQSIVLKTKLAHWFDQKKHELTLSPVF
jgi:hypothetical protein